MMRMDSNDRTRILMEFERLVHGDDVGVDYLYCTNPPCALHRQHVDDIMKSDTLSFEQYRKVADAISRWLHIRAQHDPHFKQLLFSRSNYPTGDVGDGQYLYKVASQLGADVWHSALLMRILIYGKQPLPEPPTVIDYGKKL